MLSKWFYGVLIASLAMASPSVFAAEGVVVETVLTELRGPSGVTIRPGGTAELFETFVSEGAAGRVIKVTSGAEAQPTDVVTGFQNLTNGGSSRLTGLLFLSPSQLVIAVENSESDAFLQLYEVAGNEPQTVADAKQRLGLNPGDDVEKLLRCNIYSLARTLANDRVPDQLIAASHGSDEQPGLWKIPLRANTLAELEPFANDRQTMKPAAVAVSSQGYVVVARSRGAGSRESRLSFYNPIDGAFVMESKVDLEHIVGLAYSPKTGSLYAADFGPAEFADDPEKCGVFRIDATGAGGSDCRAVRIAEVLRPTALTFAPDGALYVTSAGEQHHISADRGKLLRITGEL